MARSKSSNRWLDEHFTDEFVKRAKHEGYRSRAVFKLKELDERYHLISKDNTIVDLGAAPGGWSEYAAFKLAGRGRVIASDILPMDAVAGAEFVQGDFREEIVLNQLLDLIGQAGADLVLSDMAPNITGNGSVDQARSMYLAELAMDLAARVLHPGGCFLVKLFQGEGFDAYLADLKQQYANVIVRKPKASRPRSREVYALAIAYNAKI